MDHALAVVDKANLDGVKQLLPIVRVELLASLAVAVGPLPRAVVCTPNPARLHAALLDWYERLLNALLPQRGTDDRALAVGLDWGPPFDEQDAAPDHPEDREPAAVDAEWC